MMKKIMLCSLLFVLLLLCGCSGEIPTSPPSLTLTIDGTAHEIQSGSFEWSTTPNGKNGQSIFADSDHPLRGTYTIIETDANKAEAAFAFDPVDYEIACWPESASINDNGETDPPPVLLIPHQDSFPLQDGCWIYQLTAEWQEKNYTGTARYAFCILRN